MGTALGIDKVEKCSTWNIILKLYMPCRCLIAGWLGEVTIIRHEFEVPMGARQGTGKQMAWPPADSSNHVGTDGHVRRGGAGLRSNSFKLH